MHQAGSGCQLDRPIWISKNNADADYGKVIRSDTTEGDWDYTDMAAKIALKVGGRGDLFSSAHQVISGTDAADTLTGKDQRDHLYGGDGDDILSGDDHRLNGHLSTVFTRLFGGKVLAVTTFNSAGCRDVANQDAWKVSA